jgi:uncharacterized protein YkwD
MKTKGRWSIGAACVRALRMGVKAPLVAAACLSLGSVVGVTAQAQDRDLRACIDTKEALRAVALLNDLRARGAPCGKAVTNGKPLVWQNRLAATAAELAADLAVRDELSHTDSQKRGFKVRLESGGYEAGSAGENLAAGQPDFESTLQAWVDSPSHCATLMQASYTEVGLSCVERRGSRYEKFWVAHLGTPLRRP